MRAKRTIRPKLFLEPPVRLFFILYQYAPEIVFLDAKLFHIWWYKRAYEIILFLVAKLVTAHPFYELLKLNNSFRANCSGKMPLLPLAATIWIACS